MNMFQALSTTLRISFGHFGPLGLGFKGLGLILQNGYLNLGPF